MKELLNKVYNKSIKEYYVELDNDIFNEKRRFIITANPEIFMKSKKDKYIYDMLNSDKVSIVPDGIAVVKACNKIGNKVKERITGVDIAEYLFNIANDNKKRVYLFGSKKEVLEELKKKITLVYPNIELIGTTDGYIEDKEKEMSRIAKLRPDIVMVALGVPMQEKLIYNHLHEFKKGILIGVGGSFDVLSGTKKRAPKLFIKTNTVWLYRIVKEPKMLKRFYQNNIKFLFQLKH